MTGRLSGRAYSRQSGAGAAGWTRSAGAVAGSPAVEIHSGLLGTLLFVLGAVATVHKV
jgi:hypothetical protein